MDSISGMYLSERITGFLCDSLILTDTKYVKKILENVA